jgi:hypothetical protein
MGDRLQSRNAGQLDAAAEKGSNGHDGNDYNDYLEH